MSVTSWRGSSEAVVESGMGVISELASSVDEPDIGSSSEVVEPVSERVSEELASVEPVESPVRVLTTVVTTFVLVWLWLPDASEILTAVIVLTKVVTTCALD